MPLSAIGISTGVADIFYQDKNSVYAVYLK